MVQTIASYLITKKIYESDNSEVYRSIRKGDRQPFILKVLKQDYPTARELTRYKQEYEITRNLNLDGVIKAYGLETYKRSLVIILEDFGALSLKELMNNSLLPTQVKDLKEKITEFLHLAIKITETLGKIHAANIIHKDINPSNIVLNPDTKELKIIDFGLSTILTRENPVLKHPNVLEGTLAYISPEQTGRMNRSLDYRTDFYSLGVTFYELLTEKLPFPINDPMELVHCQIAKQPLLPNQIIKKKDDQVLPKVISDIIVKLMAKTAEDRYQSAWGLKADLEECLQQLETTGVIKEFPLGSQDISDRFAIPQKLYGRDKQIKTLLAAFERVSSGVIKEIPSGRKDVSDRFGIPQKLYGRDKEIKTLLAAFERVASGTKDFEIQKKERELNQTVTILEKQMEIMLVKGYSGIGKSALVREIYKPITQKRGYFIAGKFDQFQRNIPYSAIVAAFQGLVKQLLSESSIQLQKWRKKLLVALGSNAQVIIDVIPEVELIVGKQPPVMSLGLMESQNRFNLVFKNFIKVFCAQEHPLVIFLDDLQWVDSATLRLIELISSKNDTPYLFLIGAYRDNEVDSAHSLSILLEELQKQKVVINQITLTPLTIDCVKQLIAETLHTDISSVQPLAELVMVKTRGNPFFVNQFLKTLHLENLLNFDFDRLCWEWDITQIEAMEITDNVVELMINKIKKLSAETQQVLKLAACVGAFFDLNTLSIISEKSNSEVFEKLLTAVESGLILSISELDSQLLIQDYKFSHDRIQQAAYTLIDESEKETIHLKIGKLLLAKLSPQERSDRLFELVDHLNLAQNLIKSDRQQIELISLNLEAGKKAKQAMAYVAAVEYLTIAIEHLNDNSWQTNYQLAFEIYQQKLEVEYLNGNYNKCESLIKLLLENAQSSIEKADTYNFVVQLYTMLARYSEAIEAGRKGLQLLDVDLPEDDYVDALNNELTRAKLNLGDKKIASLVDEPEMSILEKKVAVKLLVNLLPPAYFSSETLFSLISTKSSNLCFEYGPIPESAMAYSCYATILLAHLKDYQSAYELGLVSIKISERFNDLASKSKACHMFANHILHWVKPSKLAKPINDEGYKLALESGNIQSAGYIAHHRLNHRMFEGENLEEIFATLPNYLQFVSQPKNSISYNTILAHQLAIFNLSGTIKNKLSFYSNETTEEKYIENCQSDQDDHSLCIYYIFKSYILYLYEEYKLALEYSLLAEKILPFIVCLLPEAEYNFYSSLILTALYLKASEVEQKEYWTKLEANQQQMKTWANNCPENFLHKYLLVKAEIARITGKDLEAIDLYDRSIASINKNEFIQNRALVKELTAKFWLRKDKEEIAQLYLTKAHYTYQLWGAKSKVEDLELKYGQLLLKMSNNETTGIREISCTTSETSGSNSSVLDLTSVVKASQALAEEIVLDKLLKKLMKIVIENAGAQKGFLILEEHNHWLIEAEGRANKDNDVILQSILIDSLDPDDNKLLSIPIINYVAHTQENIVLNDASNEGRFMRDPYIVVTKPKSILCTPLLNQGKLIGILYLENNLTTGAFTPQRVEILKILSAQAAISIQNSRLYTQLEDYSHTLEEKVEQRTLALKMANLELKRLANLDGLTKVANRRYFDEYLSQQWRQLAREQKPLSLILFDVDFFKLYNDHYGHQAGDDCLIKVSQAAKEAVKRPADLVARYGGEEFVVVIPQTDIEGAIIVADRIQRNLENLQIPHAKSEVNPFVTISLGVTCQIPTLDSNCTQIIGNADSALYQAKREGRNRYCHS